MVITILEVVKRLIQMLWDLNLTQLSGERGRTL